jgi:hypothetical protein
MTKKVADLTCDELDQLAAQAWFEASQSALAAGVPVVGRDPESGKLVKRYPDGRTENFEDTAYQPETPESRARDALALANLARLKKTSDMA